MVREKLKPLDKFDILYTEDFNPNSRKLVSYRTGILKEHLALYLVSLCKLYYEQQYGHYENADPSSQKDESGTDEKVELELHQCKYCGTVYDMEVGEPDNNIQSGTPFSSLPETYLCPLCESGKDEFILVPRSDALSSGFITSH